MSLTDRVYASIARQMPEFFGSVSIRLDPVEGALVRFYGWVAARDARKVLTIIEQEIGGG